MEPARSSTARVVRGGVVLLVVVAVVTAALWALQRRLVYFPDSSAVPPAGDVVPGARDLTLETVDGLRLGAWLLPSLPSDGAEQELAVLVLPGNGGNRLGRVGLALELARRGFTVLLVDYRGYGGNPGSPSEQGLSRDADAAVSALTELGHPPGRTIYLGESLGTGVAAALAVRHPPAGLVLRSPFPELADVGAHHYPWLPVRRLLRDRFPVLEHVRELDVPVTVVSGSSDSVVPAALSARVADAAPGLVEELVIDGAEHNDPVMFGPTVADAVARLAASLR